MDLKRKSHEEINAKYKTLYDYDVPVREEEKAALAGLHNAFTDFEAALQEAKYMLQEQQEVLRKRLLSDLDTYGRGVTEFAEEFARNAPYALVVAPGESRATAIERAFEEIERMKKEVENRENYMKQLEVGLTMFKIEQPPSREIQEVNKVC